MPLSSVRGVLGAITLEADRTNAFSDDDQFLTSLFAPQATIVIERSLLREQLIRQYSGPLQFVRFDENRRQALSAGPGDHAASQCRPPMPGR